MYVQIETYDRFIEENLLNHLPHIIFHVNKFCDSHRDGGSKRKFYLLRQYVLRSYIADIIRDC